MRSMFTGLLGFTEDIVWSSRLHSYVFHVKILYIVKFIIFLACGCSSFGSVREDCEQMTGRCVCKPGIQGQKCTICTSHNKMLGPNGCVSGITISNNFFTIFHSFLNSTVDLTTLPPTTCRELTCHFGATCVERGGLAICECHTECEEETDAQVRASNNLI